MDDQYMQALVGLLRYEIYQIPLPKKLTDMIHSMDKQYLYDIAVHHDLAHLVGDALEKNRLLEGDDRIAELFDVQKMTAFFRYKQLTYELEQVCRVLENEKIRFLPLKGSVIRNLYPEEWFRVSCDVDILVDFENLERTQSILKNTLQYRQKGMSSHDVSLYSQSDVHLELHFSLVEDRLLPSASAVLARVWEYTTPAEGAVYQMTLSPEMLYFYHIAHMAKHVLASGCGVRFVLDTKILCDFLKKDGDATAELLKEAELATFEAYAVRLADVWFGQAAMDDELYVLHRFIVEGGSYGNIENNLSAKTEIRRKNAFQYFLYRMFPPKRIIQEGYPITQKHPVLLPLFYVVRIFHRLLVGNKKEILMEMKTKAQLSSEKQTSLDAMFSMLALRSQKTE